MENITTLISIGLTARFHVSHNTTHRSCSPIRHVKLRSRPKHVTKPPALGRTFRRFWVAYIYASYSWWSSTSILCSRMFSDQERFAIQVGLSRIKEPLFSWTRRCHMKQDTSLNSFTNSLQNICHVSSRPKKIPVIRQWSLPKISISVRSWPSHDYQNQKHMSTTLWWRSQWVGNRSSPDIHLRLSYLKVRTFNQLPYNAS